MMDDEADIQRKEASLYVIDYIDDDLLRVAKCCAEISPFLFVRCKKGPDSKVHGANMGPSGADRTQVGPMLAPWTLLSGRPWDLGDDQSDIKLMTAGDIGLDDFKLLWVNMHYCLSFTWDVIWEPLICIIYLWHQGSLRLKSNRPRVSKFDQQNYPYDIRVDTCNFQQLSGVWKSERYTCLV